MEVDFSWRSIFSGSRFLRNAWHGLQLLSQAETVALLVALNHAYS